MQKVPLWLGTVEEIVRSCTNEPQDDIDKVNAPRHPEPLLMHEEEPLVKTQQ